MDKKILLISGFPVDSLESGANRLRKLAYGLSENGYEVFWLAPEASHAVEPYIKTINSSLQKGASKLKKNLFLFAEVSKWLEKNSGVAVISLPPPWLVFGAALLAIRFTKKIWLDFRDPLLNQAINPRGFLFRAVMGCLEKIAVSYSAGSIYASSRISDMVGGIAKKQTLVYAGISPKEKEEFATKQNLSSRSFNDTKLRVIYGGSFYSGRSPIVLLQALVQLREEHKDIWPRLELRFFCSFPQESDRAQLLSMIQKLGLEKVFLVQGLVSRSAFLEELRNATAAMIITHAKGSAYAIPGKIYDYILANRSILCLSDDIELKEFCQKFSLQAHFASQEKQQEIVDMFLRLAHEEQKGHPPTAFEALSVKRQAAEFLRHLS